jgi:hypothetical protein
MSESLYCRQIFENEYFIILLKAIFIDFLYVLNLSCILGSRLFPAEKLTEGLLKMNIAKNNKNSEFSKMR